MLDEEKLSGKLAILEKWMGAIVGGAHDMTPGGARAFHAVLEQCRREATALEQALCRPLPALVARGGVALERGRTEVQAGLQILGEAGDLP